MKIYIDQGVSQKAIRQLKKKYNFSIVTGHMNEQRIRSATDVPQPFRLDSSLLCSGDFLAGSEFYDLERVIGKSNRNDIDHLYTAYREKCDCFITANPRDFIRLRRNDATSIEKREKLEDILKDIKIMELDEFIRYCEKTDKK